MELSALSGARRNEDIALDLMKFIASTVGPAKLAGPSAGFHAGAEIKAEDQAAQLLELYSRCLKTVNGGK